MQKPDVVLLDIGLPGMSGWELARQLQALPGMETARLVAMSGFGHSQDQVHSFEVGCELHLLKPVDPLMLERILREQGPCRPDMFSSSACAAELNRCRCRN